MMNNYICEYVNNDKTGTIYICVRACSKVQARSIVRMYLRQRGYMILLKDINVCYINNAAKPVNV